MSCIYIADPSVTDGDTAPPSTTADPGVLEQPNKIQLSEWEITGIVIGSCLVFTIVVGVTCLIRRRLRKNRPVSIPFQLLVTERNPTGYNNI